MIIFSVAGASYKHTMYQPLVPSPIRPVGDENRELVAGPPLKPVTPATPAMVVPDTV